MFNYDNAVRNESTYSLQLSSTWPSPQLLYTVLQAATCQQHSRTETQSCHSQRKEETRRLKISKQFYVIQFVFGITVNE